MKRVRCCPAWEPPSESLIFLLGVFREETHNEATGPAIDLSKRGIMRLASARSDWVWDMLLSAAQAATQQAAALYPSVTRKPLASKSSLNPAQAAAQALEICCSRS